MIVILISPYRLSTRRNMHVDQSQHTLTWMTTCVTDTVTVMKKSVLRWKCVC